jgi:hypothetical protein
MGLCLWKGVLNQIKFMKQLKVIISEILQHYNPKQVWVITPSIVILAAAVALKPLNILRINGLTS